MITKIETEERLKKNIPTDIIKLSELFYKNNKKLYLVGGCIRDTFLQRSVKDYDVCTDAITEEIVQILKDNNIQYNLQGEHFGVVVAKMEYGDYEIATFRTDTKIDGDNRKPKVSTGVSIEEDVKRRDFTICALFYDIQKSEVIDLVGGIDDLNKKIVRCVGVPSQRFDEDHLRKLRAIRFASKLSFKIDDFTLKAIKDNNELNISKERIYNELYSAFNSAEDSLYFIDLLFDSTLNETIFKGLNVTYPKVRSLSTLSFNTFLTSILSEDYTISADKLVKNYVIPHKTANSIMWLLEWQRNYIKDIDVFKMYNTRKNTDITDSDILYIGPFVSMAFMQFKPIENLAEKLMSKGLKGPELGKKIRELNNEKFFNDNKYL